MGRYLGKVMVAGSKPARGSTSNLRLEFLSFRSAIFAGALFAAGVNSFGASRKLRLESMFFVSRNLDKNIR